MAARPTTIDEYLERLPAAQRKALQQLRQTIKSAAPEAEECISYQLAAFRLNGMLPLRRDADALRVLSDERLDG